MAEKKTGCLEVLVGLGVLWALPGAILDECSRERGVRGNLVAPVEYPGGSGWGAVEKVEIPVDPVLSWDAEVRRRFRESAPWARR
jgi:hypothetical protein